jgi:hypothetical protein
MSTLKTLPNDADVIEFINSVDNEVRRSDALILLDLFSKVTKQKPKMWGTAIIGYGMYHYKSERSSQEGDWPLTAFSPRKQNLTLYIMPGFEELSDLLAKLGKHKTSVSCLYINKLSDVDMKILEAIIAKSYAAMKQQHKS